MAFASQGEDGQIAPTVVGARIRALKKPNDMAQTLGWHTLERNLKRFFPFENKNVFAIVGR